MKKSLKVLAAVCSIAFFLGLSACSNGSDSVSGSTSGGSSDGTMTGGETSGSPAASQVIKSGLKFDFSNAKAIAAVDKENSGRAAYSINSRTATPNSSVDDSPLLKILEDGRFESALTLADNANLANIKEIYKSPLEGSNDIFIVFDGTSSFYDEQVTVDENGKTVSSNSVYKTLGQLVCIHEDNTIADILKIEGSTSPYDDWENYLSLETDRGVMFDAAGNLYYMARKWNSSGVVYKFDPKTNEITKLTPFVSGTNYSSFKITKDGKIIFVEGSRWNSGSSATFLRAIPVDDPNNFSNIYYNSTDGSGLYSWVYDEKNEVMYYVRDNGLYKAERSGDSFKDGELISSGIDSELNAGIYFSSKYISVVDWRTDEVSYLKNNVEIKFKLVDDNENLLPENVVRYIVEDHARDSSANYIQLSVDDVDIRFDVFKNIEGYEDIYNATKDLKNAEAIKALDTFKLRNLFYDIFDDNHGYYGYTKNYISKSSAYRHNLLADILYVKDSDTLLCNSEELINSSTGVRGSEYFGKNGDYYLSSVYLGIFSSQSTEGFLSVRDKNDNLVFKKSDGSVDYSVILKDAFSQCYTHGEKEFRLDIFKDDGTYGDLYSDLTDEAALKWITEDDERLFWFGHAIFYTTVIDGKWVSDKNFSDLFFIKGTNEPAYKQTKESVSYSSLNDYTVNSDGSLWARYTNTSSSYGSEDKYFYFVQITDSDGCLINDFNEVNLPDGKVSQTIENDGTLYMKYSLLNSNGGESGFHQIYKVNFADGAYVNMFKNVPNNEKLEVISYSVGADRLYYSAVCGTSVENGVVSTVTNEYNPLKITKKLSAIYTF